MSKDKVTIFSIFGAKPDDIEYTIQDFVDRFGRETFEEQIHPYLKINVGFLFCAPQNHYRYYFLDRLCVNMSQRLHIPYERSAQFLVVNIPKDQKVYSCPICNTDVTNLYPLFTLGVDNEGCLSCYHKALNEWEVNFS